MEKYAETAVISDHDRQIRYIQDIAPQLAEKFDQFAITTMDYTRIHNRVRDNGTAKDGDELYHGQLARPGEEDFLTRIEPEKQAILINTLGHIAEEISALDLEQNEQPDWAQLSFSLLDKATGEDMWVGYPKVNEKLLAALSCSLLSESFDSRVAFLRAAVKLGAGEALSHTLHDCDLTFIVNPDDEKGRIIERFNRWEQTFTATEKQVEDFLFYSGSREEWGDKKLKPKATQKELMEAYFEGEVSDDLIIRARKASLMDEEKQSPYIDPFKIERFAIQQMFIKDMMHEIFGIGSLSQSSLANLLEQDRAYGETLGDLTNNAQMHLRTLSTPIVDMYKVTEDQTEDLTPRQKATRHFEDIIAQGKTFQAICMYLNYSTEFKSDRGHIARHNNEPWFFSASGAAAPNQTYNVLSRLITEARKLHAKTGDTPGPEEILDLALTKRKHLMRISMMHITDFGFLSREGSFLPVDYAMNDTRPSLLGRDEDGKLTLELPTETKDLGPRLGSYTSTTLGCPAGRLAINSAELKDRGLDSTNNMIDYVVEVIIREAYERGLLDIKKYN